MPTKKPTPWGDSQQPHEKSIKIIKNKHPGSHRSETHVFMRERHETYCMDLKCKFYKKPTVQGVCHTTQPLAARRNKLDNGYIDAVTIYARRSIEDVKKVMDFNLRRHGRKKTTLRQKFNYLLRELETMWANNTFTLDELVRLRAFRSEAVWLLQDKTISSGEQDWNRWSRKRISLLKKYRENH